MNDLDTIMGFNPSDLSVFQEQPQASYEDPLIYKTKPSESITEDGVYHSVVKILYNPFDVKQSIVKQLVYSFRDENGFFMVDSNLVNGDKTCPIFTSWKKLWYPETVERRAFAKEHYQRSEPNWVLVQIMEDENQPENIGKLMFWKMPYAVLEKLTAKMNPVGGKKQPLQLMDYLIGRALEIVVQPGPDDPKHPERKKREISYTLCDFSEDYKVITKIDGTPLFSDEEYAIIDEYVTLRDKAGKGKVKGKDKTPEQIKEEIIEINKSEIGNKMRDLYKKAIEYLKENAPNLVDHFYFKEWDEATRARVMKLLSKLEKMEDPSSTTQSTPVPTEIIDPIEETSETEDDLPF